MDLNSVRAVEFVDESAFDLAHTFQVQTCTTVLSGACVCVCVCVRERGGRELLTPWEVYQGCDLLFLWRYHISVLHSQQPSPKTLQE